MYHTCFFLVTYMAPLCLMVLAYLQIFRKLWCRQVSHLKLLLFACCCDCVQIPAFFRCSVLSLGTWIFYIQHHYQVQWHCWFTSHLDRHWDALKNEGNQPECKPLLAHVYEGLRGREREKKTTERLIIGRRKISPTVSEMLTEIPLGDLIYTAKISCSSQKLGLTFSFFW